MRAKRLVQPGHQNKKLGALTPRELEVVKLVGECLSDTAIGSSMGIKPKTVMNYLSAIYQKLDYNSNPAMARRVRLARYARRNHAT